MHSLQLLLALASAGTGYTAPDPDSPMEISNLLLSTENAGACSTTPPNVPTQSAQVAVKFRVKNKRLDDYTVNVYLDQAGSPPSIFALGSEFIPSMGYSVPDWSLTYLTDQDAKGVFTLLGYVEGGLFGVMTTQWTFRVTLTDTATGQLVQTLTAPWSKTYGTCE